MLDFILLLAGAGLPALALVIWFYRMDSLRPEPLRYLGKFILLGFLAAVPAIVLELIVDRPAAFLPGVMRVAWTAFVTAGFVEEGLKYFVLRRFLFRMPAFDERMDGIVYAACVSLGFAFAENILYGLSARSALLLRAFTAVPMHAMASGVMGYYIGLARLESDPAQAKKGMNRGLALAVLIHGSYDFFLFLGSWASLLSLAVLVWALVGVRRLVRLARDADRRSAALRNPEPSGIESRGEPTGVEGAE